MNDSRKGRGRPPEDKSFSAQANYQALALRAKELIDVAKREGRKLKIKEAVREVMLESVRERNTEGLITRFGLVDSKIKTHYTEARKILAAWNKAGKK